jgi:hypothetical protein
MCVCVCVLCVLPAGSLLPVPLRVWPPFLPAGPLYSPSCMGGPISRPLGSPSGCSKGHGRFVLLAACVALPLTLAALSSVSSLSSVGSLTPLPSVAAATLFSVAVAPEGRRAPRCKVSRLLSSFFSPERPSVFKEAAGWVGGSAGGAAVCEGHSFFFKSDTFASLSGCCVDQSCSMRDKDAYCVCSTYVQDTIYCDVVYM